MVKTRKTRKTKGDWRSLPRKPAHLKRSKKIVINLTPTEYDQIRKGAEDGQRTMNDWIVKRCLGKQAR